MILCQHPQWSSSSQLLDLVYLPACFKESSVVPWVIITEIMLISVNLFHLQIMSMAENVNLSEDLRLHSSDMLGCICRLVESLLHLDSVGNYVALSSRKLLSDEVYLSYYITLFEYLCVVEHAICVHAWCVI